MKGKILVWRRRKIEDKRRIRKNEIKRRIKGKENEMKEIEDEIIKISEKIERIEVWKIKKKLIKLEGDDSKLLNR